MAVLTVSWCCSVGSTWALLLREHDVTARPGPMVMWISSGVPITEPVPESLARELLAEHGYRLFSDPDNPPRTRSVHRLGFVSALRGACPIAPFRGSGSGVPGGRVVGAHRPVVE
ncbi:MAG: hypothetical protein DLM62_14125 [Pseudonocardiales bacterium]|nr:MAG: hypothetical protein DLM62_14125 [Pseudonocardiales bacterium]